MERKRQPLEREGRSFFIVVHGKEKVSNSPLPTQLEQTCLCRASHQRPHSAPLLSSPRRAWRPRASSRCCSSPPLPQPGGEQGLRTALQGEETPPPTMYAPLPRPLTCPGKREYSRSSDRSTGTCPPEEYSWSPSRMTDLAFSLPLESQQICPRTVTGSFRQAVHKKSTFKSQTRITVASRPPY